MRTFSAAEQARWNSRGGVRHLLRVFVKDSGGTYRDLTTYASTILSGLNFVTSGTWKDAVDSIGQTASFTCKREVARLSINPLMTTSALNLGLDPNGSYAPLIDVGRKVKADRAIIADGAEPVSGDWIPCFEGYIDTVKLAEQGDAITIVCSDNAALLRDTFIERERIYSYAGAGGLPSFARKGLQIWGPGEAFQTGDWSVGTEANASGYFNENQAGSGNSGTTEPIWPTSAGNDVAEGSLDWVAIDFVDPTHTEASETVMQQIINDNLASPPALRCDVSPSFLLRWFQQQRQSILDALRAIVDCFAWDLRYRYHDDTTSWQLTLATVNRTPGSPDWTFTDPLGSGSSGTEGYSWTQLDVDISGIRNAIRCIVSDVTLLDAAGNPTRVVCEASDSTSITKYGRRFMEVSEGSTSGVGTTAQGTALATSILSDLKNPKADAAWSCPFFPWVEIGDFYQWDPDALMFDTSFSAGVVGYEHTIDGEKGRTTITTRGVPSSGYARWLSRQTYAAPQQDTNAHKVTKLGPGQTTVVTKATVGGQEISITPPTAINAQAVPSNYEIHVSTVNGFTPSLATLKQAGQSLHFNTGNLIPGLTYYVVYVPYGYNSHRIVKGQPSQQISFVAGQAATGHISSFADVSRRPLNGDFENNLNPNGPPDHWSVISGTWSTDIKTTTGLSGLIALQFTDVAVTRKVSSDPFVVEPLMLYKLDGWIKEHAVLTSNGKLQLTWLDSTLSVLSSISVLGGVTSSYNKRAVAGFAPSNAAYARVDILTASGAVAHGFDVDSVQVRQLRMTGQLQWGNSALSAAAVTHYATPGGGAGATDANERKIQIPGDCVLSQLQFRCRTGSTGVQYVATLRQNGSDQSITCTLTAGGTQVADSSNIVIENVNFDGAGGGNDYSVKLVSTLPGGGPVGAVDAFITLGIWQ